MADLRYIAVEGPVGVGKTSLAGLLAKVFSGRPILEVSHENPFLARFYQDRKKYAFQTQIFFLLSRYQQQQELQQLDLFNRLTISDYLFAKDRIFASVNLDENEMALYERIYQLLQGTIPTPDLVIYLQARAKVLLSRIRQRNREYERSIEAGYLQTLVEAYNSFFFHYNDSPLLVIDTSEIDFVHREEDLAALVKEIQKPRKGTWYYVPKGR
ncbi:MAG: deoxynucleoside kinase [Deltaproteobacteria bacterium]|nr:deoxynucleoside kinase [Deltaproteobacteria bacterium]MBW2121918.1 deoxynucleoside kinase [Deltaproteobacteria bacterium]